jgi:hypothetical protein
MNLYERFTQKKLPEKIQKEIECRLSFEDSADEKMFLAGFLVCKRIKEIRKELGLED